MSATVTKLPTRHDALLTKRALASEVGRSERWIELKQREGLPIARTDRSGRRLYRLADVERWMVEGVRPRSVVERLAVLEASVAELRAIIEGRKT